MTKKLTLVTSNVIKIRKKKRASTETSFQRMSRSSLEEIYFPTLNFRDASKTLDCRAFVLV